MYRGHYEDNLIAIRTFIEGQQAYMMDLMIGRHDPVISLYRQQQMCGNATQTWVDAVGITSLQCLAAPSTTHPLQGQWAPPSQQRAVAPASQQGTPIGGGLL